MRACSPEAGVRGPELLNANLSFLEGCSGATTMRALKGSAGKPSLLKVETSPEGGLTWRSGGSGILLHSARDPEGEAARLLQGWISSDCPDMRGTLAVFGFAGAFHVSALMDAAGEGALVFVADLSPESFLAALEHVDLRGLVRPGVELFFSVSGDPAELHNDFRTCLRKRARIDFSVLRHPSTLRTNPAGYSRLLEGVREQARIEAMNRNTSAKFIHAWVADTLRSLPWTLKAAPAQALKGSFAGVPGIVVGAGPSLSRAVPWLAQVAPRALIFSAGTALKPLLKGGVRPDFVVSVDNDPKTLRQYEGVSLDGTHLLSCVTMFPEMFQPFEGRAFVFSANLSEPLNQWIESFGALPERATVGGTVATTMMDLARLCGCGPIFLCGMDLAMGDDGSTHSSGSVYEGAKALDTAPVPGNYSPTVRTTWQFSLYIRFIDNYIYLDKKSGGAPKYYNATDAGARLARAELVLPSKLPELIGGPSPGKDKAAVIERLRLGAVRPDLGRALGAVRSAIADLKEASAAAGCAIEACKVAFGSEESVAHSGMLFKELERLDSTIRRASGGGLLLDAALRLVCLDLMAGGPSKGSLRETAESSMKLYSHVEAAAGGIIRTLEDSLKGLEGGGSGL